MEKPTIERPASRPSPRRFRSRLLMILVVLGSAFFLSVVQYLRTGQPPFIHRESVWSIAIYEGPSPLELAPTDATTTTVLTAEDVTDVRALFVADPFMVEHDEKWYMFVEVLNADTKQGDIGLATSDDGLNWNYQGIVLDENTHMSYPSVFMRDGQWWMLPQSNDGVHLYSATEFPTKWKREHTIFTGDQHADPTLFRHNDLWWMFVGRPATHDRLRLFYADRLEGSWEEHPQSPIVDNDGEIARPGGPVVQFEGELYRFAQDCVPKYGNQLRALRITELTKDKYAEELYSEGPVLTAGKEGWNSQGMHHNDPHMLKDGTWRAAVDGHKKTWILQAKP